MTASSIISGFTDEVSDDLDVQIKVLNELGWSHIDLRTVNGKNISSLSDDEFDRVHEQLTNNGITISCFGSTIANWSRIAQDSLEVDVAELTNSIRHMKKADVRYIRIMSYKVDSPVRLDSDLESLVIENIKELVRIAEANDIICLHENCETWGGQSYLHSLRLLEQVNSPSLKLVFDSGNPVSMLHVAGNEPFNYQDSLVFFEEVHQHIAYLHIKDAHWDKNTMKYTFPGKGAAQVKEILKRVRQYGMGIPIAIEPHVAVVFHDPSVKAPLEERWKTFIQYGHQFVAIAEEAGIHFS